MRNGNYVSYYIGLLAIQVTVSTLIAAGVIALYQIHDKQTPKRSLNTVVNKPFFVGYLAVILGLLVITSLFSWSALGRHDIYGGFDFHLNKLALNPTTAFAIVFTTVIVCLVFFYLLWRSNGLLDIKEYLNRLSGTVNYQKFSDYLFHTYSSKPTGYIEIVSYALGVKKRSKGDEAAARKRANENIKNWDSRYELTANTVDPLSPFVEYCRYNALRASGDVEKVGLPILEKQIVNYISAANDDLPYLFPYLTAITVDLKEALQDSPIAVRKRLIDLLTNVAMHFCEVKEFSAMISVASNIYVFLKSTSSEDVKTHGIKQLRGLTDLYKEVDKKESDWRKFDNNIQELALIVARIAEDHYHNIDELSPVSIIENNRIELNDFGTEMANYFAAYDDLFEKYPSIIPIIYFDAIDVSGEALINAVNRSKAVKRRVGMTASHYSDMINTLYFIFYNYARSAITNKNRELLKNTVYRMIRGLEFMDGKNVDDCKLDLADFLVSLGIRVACDSELKDETAYGSSRIVDNIIDAINRFADHAKLAARKSSIEHDLFTIVYSDEAQAFEKRLIDW